MSSAAATLPVNLKASRPVEAKSSVPEVTEQPFDRVLAQEVNRQGGEQKAGESASLETAKTEAEPVAEVDASVVGDEAQASVQSAPDAAAIPWLLAMQQLAQMQPPVTTGVVPTGVGVVEDVGEAGAASQQITLLESTKGLTASVRGVSIQGAGSDTGSVALATGVLGVAPEIQGADAQLAKPLAANAAAELGNNLPLAQSATLEKPSFATELSGLLGGEEDAKTQQSVAVAQPFARPVEAGVEQANQVAGRHVVAEPVGDARWGDAVAQRVSMMLGRQEQQIEMQLNPPHLGPMEVRLTLGQEQASVVFASQHAGVREALAAATPKLTALLADQGIHLVNVQVASDSLQQHAQEQSRQQASFAGQGQGQRGESRYPGDIQSPRWNGDVALPVARSGVSLYV